MRPRSRAGRAVLIVLAASTLPAFGACGELLNIDGIEIIHGPAGDAGLAPACEPSTFRCAGAALELCEPTGALRTVRVCSTPELCCASPEQCAQPGCVPPSCVAGERRCQGEVLEECNRGQTGFVELDRCASALHCNASLGRCTEQPCDATQREQQCSGPELEQCLPGAASWTPVEACATSGLCDPSADACAPRGCRIGGEASPPSPYQCVGGNLMRCNDALTGWEHVETCLNPSNCNALIEPLAGDPYAETMTAEQLASLGCAPPACAPGRFRCDGADLYLCGLNRTGYLDRVASCASPRHCDARGGRCLEAPCVVGQRQCSGDDYQVCRAEGWVTETTCSRGAPCDPAQGCLPTRCEPNEYRCDGAVLERCNVARTGWIPVRACDSAGLCNVAAKRCDAPLCQAGEVRCSPDGHLERCDPERTGWALVSDCATETALPPGASRSPLCDPSGAGQCTGQWTCVPGALRCNGRDLERCRDDVWRPHSRCATAAQCDASAGACQVPVCEPGAYRCVAPGAPPTVADELTPRRGLTLEVCAADGTGYVPAQACAPSELCDDVHGQCDICEPSQLLCSDRELLVCTADGQERTLYEVCEQGCVEVTAGTSNRATCREDLAVSGN